jgi:hypothetical protein
MSYTYVPLAGGAELADALSRGVYKLSQPDGVRPAGYATTHAFGWVTHPESGAVMLELNDDQFIPCHVAADPEPLLTMLAALKDDNGQPMISQAEAGQLRGVVQQAGGQRVPLSMLVPPRAMATALTRAEAEANGWFALLAS